MHALSRESHVSHGRVGRFEDSYQLHCARKAERASLSLSSVLVSRSYESPDQPLDPKPFLSPLYIRVFCKSVFKPVFKSILNPIYKAAFK